MRNSDAPVTDAELDDIADHAYALAVQGNYPGALALCERLIHNEATVLAGRRERAAILSHKGDLNAAIDDLEYVVAAMPQEPADFHALGILQLQNGATQAAVDSFQGALEAGVVAQSDYYANSSRLFRAEARLQLKDYAGAHADAALLPDGYHTYIPSRAMRSKEQIISEAMAGLARVATSTFKFKK